MSSGVVYRNAGFQPSRSSVLAGSPAIQKQVSVSSNRAVLCGPLFDTHDASPTIPAWVFRGAGRQIRRDRGPLQLAERDRRACDLGPTIDSGRREAASSSSSVLRVNESREGTRGGWWKGAAAELVVRLTVQRLTRAARAHVPKPMRRTACLHVSRAMQAARRRADLIYRAGSAGGPKPGRAGFYLELGRRSAYFSI
jgi:hypothetical protein